MRLLPAFLLLSLLIACGPQPTRTPTPSAALQAVERTTVEPPTALPTSKPTDTAVPTATSTDTLEPTGVAVAQANDETGIVTRIIDGDTIAVQIGQIGFRIRYIGVNTPERGETCSQEATAANAALVEGQTVRLVRDTNNTDRYGRLLRYVYVGDTFVNAQLVADGWAEAVEYPPDTRHAADFEALQASARAAGGGCYALGVWGGAVAQPSATSVPPTHVPPTLVLPTATKAPTIYYVNSGQNVNVRSDASTNAGILGSLAPATSVEILDEVEGLAVSGSTRWYEIDYNGHTGYVHSSLLSDTPMSTRPPQPTARPVQQQSAPQQPVQQPPAQQPPAQQPVVQPTQPPPPPPPPAAPAFACDCSKSCTAMASCEEAYFQLNQCQCGRRDGDNDGVPCEEICPGG